MRVVFVENHDSFSWNVIDLLPVERSELTLVHASTARAALDQADLLVIGPGPMDPVRVGLVDLVHDAARRGLPTLGVCLGHQAIGLAFGATLTRTLPTHGKREVITFRKSKSLPDVDGAREVMRYHSLSLTQVRAPLEVIATATDGTVMALEHQSLPMLGLQFHPDSFGTPQGRELVQAFWAQHLGHAPALGRTKAPPPIRPETPAPRTATPLLLSSLEGQRDFALFAPAYGPDAHWTLVTDLREGGRDVVLCEAESRSPRWFGGVARAVTPTFDVAPAVLSPRLEAPTFTRDVETIRGAIAAGDVYQVNLTLRAALGEVRAAALLALLARRVVPRFAAWVRVGDDELVTASPELLVEVDGRDVHAEPMKGTASPERRAWLEASLKDQAELAMITDLVRDDLQRVCVPRSVRVPTARRFLELPYAVQAVSDIEGTLRDEVTLDQLVRTLHPGGSVTGAPRQAALELISALEPTPRRFYCGTLGLALGTRARCALLIRTAWRTHSTWTWGVGNGITWNSEPSAELDEVHLKLGALR